MLTKWRRNMQMKTLTHSIKVALFLSQLEDIMKDVGRCACSPFPQTSLHVWKELKVFSKLIKRKRSQRKRKACKVLKSPGSCLVRYFMWWFGSFLSKSLLNICNRILNCIIAFRRINCFLTAANFVHKEPLECPFLRFWFAAIKKYWATQLLWDRWSV